MTARFDLFERFASYLVQPIASFVRSMWYHPVDTVVDTAVAAGEFAQEHPLTTCAIIGLGAYAHHRRWLRLGKWGCSVHVDADTRLGGVNIHTGAYIGKRRV